VAWYSVGVKHLSLVVAALVVAVGCGDDDGVVSMDAGPGTDAEVTPDAEADGGVAVECDFPAPRLGTSAAATALATDPARCGQPDHQWLDPAGMGDIVERQHLRDLPAAILQAALEGEGLVLPRELEYDVVIDQILYTTQDRGETIEATAAVAYPEGYDPSEPVDAVLLLHGTTGFSDACAPSNELEGQALAALFASIGYVAVAPDYIGLKALGEASPEVHPYLVGQATAIASLDSVRALGKLAAEERGGLCITPRIHVFGGSQGGHAALWVDRMSDTYAPEIELLGTVATVPPMDLLAQVERGLTELVDATANSTAMLGAASTWYGYGDRLDEVFVAPFDEDVPAYLLSSCDEDAPELPELTLEEVFQPALLEAADAGTFGDLDPWGCVIAENGLTTTSVERTRDDPASYGILLTFGAEDSLVHTPIEREAYRSLCEAGMPMEMVECTGAGHGTGTLWALPEILAFMEARAAGEAWVQPSCEPPAAVICEGTPET